MKRVLFFLFMLLSSASISYSQSQDIDKAFRNFLIIAQYAHPGEGHGSTLLNGPWRHYPSGETRTHGGAYSDHYSFWTGGFISHIDLSPNDINSVMEVRSQYYENMYGEYQIPVHLKDRDFVREFKTTNTNGEIRIVCENGFHDNGIYFYTDNPLKYMGDDTGKDRKYGKYVTICRPNENEITKYAPTGSPINVVSAKYHNGRVVELNTDDVIHTFVYEGDNLKEVRRCYEPNSPAKQLISFQWNQNVLKSFSYTESDGSSHKLYTKVLNTNEKGLWTQLLLYEITNGEDIPVVLYERIFDGKKLDKTNSTIQPDSVSTVNETACTDREAKINLNNYLLISQYANLINKLWGDMVEMHYSGSTVDMLIDIYNICSEGLLTHIDLSINDIDIMPIKRMLYVNKFGEYVKDDSSERNFITIKSESAISIPSDEEIYYSVMNIDGGEQIVDRLNQLIILHRNRNKLAHYEEEGILKNEFECKFDELGRIEFMYRNSRAIHYEKEGYYVKYNQNNNISNITLKEYNQVGYEAYELSKTTDITFSWDGNVPQTINITRTSHRSGSIETLMMKMNIMESNTDGKWTKMQLSFIQGGKEIPAYLYCREFYKTAEEFQRNQSN